MSRLELPGGNWAELASPRKVQERKRRRYIAAIADMAAGAAGLPQIPNPDFGQPGQPATIPDPAHFGSAQMELSARLGDMLILCLVREWSLGDVTEEAVQALDADVFDALLRACRELGKDLVPDYSPDPDPKVSTPGAQPSPPGSSTGLPTFTIPSSVGTS